MALADYKRCEVCDGKAVYDADWWHRTVVDEDTMEPRLDCKALCEECSLTHELIVVKRTTPRSKP